MIHTFQKSLESSKKYENYLDSLLVDSKILPKVTQLVIAPKDLQQKGIDRIAEYENNTLELLEYKTDFKANKSGNVFIETTAYRSQTSHKLGWAYTSQSHKVFYWVYPWEILEIQVKYLPLEDWVVTRTPIPIFNYGFFGEGLLVPLEEIYKIEGVVRYTLHRSLVTQITGDVASNSRKTPQPVCR
jgi:hypothetical protein